MTSDDAIAYCLAKRGMQMRIGGNHVTGIAGIVPCRIGYKAPRLADQQSPSREVPALQPELPVAIVSAGRDPGEVKRCSAEPTNAGDLGHQQRKGAGERQATR